MRRDMLAFAASAGASRPVALRAPSREAPAENIPSLINAPVFKQRFPEEATSILTQGVLAVGLFPFDKNVVKFALPLAIAGWLTAFYHNLLYSGVIPETIQPCSQGVSCTEKYIELFGFLTIPMLSLLSFSTIITLLIILKRTVSK